MADRSSKTEQATPRREQKARKQGQFARSPVLVSALQFLAFVVLLSAWSAPWLADFRQATRIVFQQAFQRRLEGVDLMNLTQALSVRIAFPLMVAGSGLVLLTIGFQLLTTRMGFSLERLTQGFRNFNPVAKLRELPRQNLPTLVQSFFTLLLFGAAIYMIVRDHGEELATLPLTGLEVGISRVFEALRELLWRAAAVFLLFGAIDFIRQKRRLAKDLRMSKHEIREELKETEANPQIKLRIRRLQRDLLRRQMMKDVATATAVVVNPTHYAVALRYTADSQAAPMVVAKGKNYLALRIRQRALDHEVPLIENPPLAQALYGSVNVGQEIPPHLYRAVAEILAYIFKLSRKR